MKYTPQELSKILNQPGYSVVGGLPAKRTTAQPQQSERAFQQAVIDEAKARGLFLVAIPNGQYRAGQRMEPGLTAGMPDLILLARSGRYGALFIELKVGTNKLSKAQLAAHTQLRAAGYKVVTVWDSVDDVMAECEQYLAEASE